MTEPYGRDPAADLDHLGMGRQTPADPSDPMQVVLFGLYDDVRDYAIGIGVDVVLDVLEGLGIVDDDTATAALVLLESVPEAVLPSLDPYRERFVDAYGREVRERAANVAGLVLDADGDPAILLDPDPSPEAVEAMMDAQQILLHCQTIVDMMLVQTVEHYFGHLAEDVGYVFSTPDTGGDPFGPLDGPF